MSLQERYGPFKPQQMVEVPVWLALQLHKRNKARILLPEWLSSKHLSGEACTFESSPTAPIGGENGCVCFPGQFTLTKPHRVGLVKVQLQVRQQSALGVLALQSASKQGRCGVADSTYDRPT